ncbi:MAG: FAD-dependent oxidoreductase [Parcubacteria group bacterium]|jgi:thioredoxin reductase (NADPH)
MNENVWDLIIVGTGPAGLSASVYASRYKVKHLVIGQEPGGQINEAHKIENWPGTTSISGTELGQKMMEHAKGLGAEFKFESVMNLDKKDEIYELETSNAKYSAKSVILAMGMQYRQLNVPGEEEFKGKGVSYCPTCDAPFFQNKIIAVIGGANSAAGAALLLSEYASKVYLIYRGEKLKCDPAYFDKLSADEKITIIYGTNLKGIQGEQTVKNIVLDKPFENKNELDVDGVFVEIGSDPGAEMAEHLGVKMDEQRFIEVNPDQSTNISGIYAAGDITTGSNKMRQAITAAAEGAVAAGSVYKKLQTM